MPVDVRPDHLQIVRDILKANVPNHEVWAFGSRAKWTAKDTSDLDICIKGKESLTLNTLAHLRDDFSESSLPYKVDVVDWHGVSESFRKIIERDKVELLKEEKGGWTEVGLGKICQKIGSGATPRGGKDTYLDSGGIALIRSQNVYNDGFRAKGLAYISTEQADKLSNVSVEIDDVLLNITGDSVARVCLAPKQYLPARVNQHVAIIRTDKNKLNAKFLRYYLCSPRMQDFMLGIASSGATRNALTKGMIESFMILCPDVTRQRNIAEILSALDDKIELNRRMNETLEATAQALFKSWFINFEQWGSKKPKEWENKPLDSQIELIGGGTPKTNISEYWNGNIPWFSVVDVPEETDVFVIDTEKHITQTGLENSSAKILPVGTTIITAHGTVGKLALVGTPMTMNQSCYGIQGRRGAPYYTYFLLKNAIAELQQNTHGSVFDTITRATFSSIQVVEPTETIMCQFDNAVQPLLKKVHSNVKDNKLLSQLRDALLPKLISGELRVSEAASKVKEAV